MSNRPKLGDRPTIPGYQEPKGSGSSIPVWAIVGAIAAVVVLAGVIALASSGGDEDTGGVDGNTSADGAPVSEFRPVEVEGAALSEFSGEPNNDDAIGQPAPVVSGANFVGDDVTVGEGPAMLVFGAHWCPHCQKEVPLLAQWIDGGLLPDGVSASLVSTAVKEQPNSNFPPSTWVADTGWNQPVLTDSAGSEAGAAYGLAGFPYFVFIDADGNVARRASGELSQQQVQEYLAEITP